MSKFSLNKFLELLFEFDTETNDFALETDEYIRTVAIGQKSVKNDDGETEIELPIAITKYFKSMSEIENFIDKYKHRFNLFIGLSTVKGHGNTAEFMYKRKVLLLDFDRKDFPQYQDVRAFTEHIKNTLPLFVHLIVDSGHGYHCYTSIEASTDTERVTKINKELAEILGADVKAALATQIIRLPFSINHKDPDNKKPVSIITNNLETSPDKFKPYQLAKIEGFIEQFHRNEVFFEQVQKCNSSIEYEKETRFYCIENMLSKGCVKGERNFALGRIVKYLQLIKGYTKSSALETCQQWNLKCDPPKLKNVIEQDFNAYWNGDYKLLGCNVPNPIDQQILNRYCDKTLCRTVFENRNTDDKAIEVSDNRQMMFDNNLLKNSFMQKFTGFHYVILSVLDFNSHGLTKKELVEKLTGAKTKKCCVSEKTLNKYLKELLSLKFISYKNKVYKKTDIPNYGFGFSKYSYMGTIMLINRLISQKEFLVYLNLIRNLQQQKNVTYETIAADLRLDKANISRYIKDLNTVGLIAVNKNSVDNGRCFNVYKILI
ncbi:MAG: hypothetical protein NC120_12520 [Ruminococcus sp.]|nr:hypothetical protein [Ruminococcus sp.]